MENKISIPVILYVFLFIITVHFFSLSLTRIVGEFNLGFDPYSRLVFLFFEIIFIAKFFQKIAKRSHLKRRKLFNMMVYCLLSLIFWIVLYYFNIESKPYFFCGMVTEEEISNFYNEFNRAKKITMLIEITVISISIFIYTIFRISEMPKETKEQ